MPAICNACGREAAGAPFLGDADHAIVAETACCHCGGKLYRNDADDDGEQDIRRSAWEGE